MKLVAFTATVLVVQAAFAQSPLTTEHWNGFFGAVVAANDTNTIPFGSAFVFGPNKQIVTCSHVSAGAWAMGFTNLSYVAQTIGKRDLQLVAAFPRLDLAIYSCSEEIPGKPLDFGDFKRIRPGDTIFYAGFDARESKTNVIMSKMWPAIVTAIGSELNEGAVIDFLEFEGEGIPGYSGGPVFNDKGEILAIMREAWTKQGIKGGAPVLINRAISLDVLRAAYEPAVNRFPPIPTNSPPVLATNKTTSSLMDVIGFPFTNLQYSQWR
jgi:S1-C subfamily serine protease